MISTYRWGCQPSPGENQQKSSTTLSSSGVSPQKMKLLPNLSPHKQLPSGRRRRRIFRGINFTDASTWRPGQGSPWASLRNSSKVVSKNQLWASLKKPESETRRNAGRRLFLSSLRRVKVRVRWISFSKNRNASAATDRASSNSRRRKRGKGIYQVK